MDCSKVGCTVTCHSFVCVSFISGESNCWCLLLYFCFFKIQPLVQFFHIPSCQTGTEQGQSHQWTAVRSNHLHREDPRERKWKPRNSRLLRLYSVATKCMVNQSNHVLIWIMLKFRMSHNPLYLYIILRCTLIILVKPRYHVGNRLCKNKIQTTSNSKYSFSQSSYS